MKKTTWYLLMRFTRDKKKWIEYVRRFRGSRSFLYSSTGFRDMATEFSTSAEAHASAQEARVDTYLPIQKRISVVRWTRKERS